jgi:superfamily II RNA helicase
MIMEKNFSPVIIFSFSKKEVEGYAMSMLVNEYFDD